jgi:hypothetical protein
MRRIFFYISLFSSLTASSQSIEGVELGFDGFVGFSNIGGSVGIGPKVGFVLNENLIVGPTFRLQRSWSSNVGTPFGYSIYGGGVFAHARYGNVLFGGAEIEMLKSPINYTIINPSKSWVPSLFICGGFSKEFNSIVRINAGIYYDVINHVNSPFRQAYFMKVTNEFGQVVKIIPLIYRISFYFPLGKKKSSTSAKTKEDVEEEVEEDFR